MEIAASDKNFVVPLPTATKVMVEENVIQKDFSSYLARVISWTAMTPLFLLAYMHCTQLLTVTEQEDQRQIDVTVEITDNLSKRFSECKEILTGAARSLGNARGADPKTILDESVEQNPQLSNLSLYAPDGRLIASLGRYSTPRNFSIHDYSDGFEARIFGRAPHRSVCFAKKISEVSAYQGYSLAACYSTSIFSESFRQAVGRLDFYTQITNPQGEDIYRQAVDGVVPALPFQLNRDFVEKVEEKLRSGTKLWRSENTRDKAQVIAASHVRDSDWYVIVSQPVAMRDKELLSSLQSNGILLVIGFMGTILVGMLLGRRLNAAVDAVADQVKTLNQKQKLHPIKEEIVRTWPSELQNLYREARAMAEEIRKSEEKLREANVGLSNMVNLRTRSLKNRQEELKALQKLLAPLDEPVDKVIKETIETFAKILRLTHLELSERTAKSHDEKQIPVKGSKGTVYGYLYAYGREVGASNAGQSLARLASSISIVMENEALYNEVRYSHAKFSALFESMTEGVVLIGRSGSLLYGNMRAKRLLSIKDKQVIPDVMGWINENFRPIEYEEDYNSSEKNDVRRWASKANSNFFIETTAFVVPEFLGFAGQRKGLVIRNVTEVIQVERMKRNLVSVVAHELKTPITTIRLQADTLDRVLRKNDIEFAKKLINEMGEESFRLQQLISDWLDVSRIDVGSLALRPVIVPVEDILKVARTSVGKYYPDLEVRNAISKEAECMMVDRGRMLQVFINILENVARYRSEFSPVCTVKTRRIDDEIEISFEDNGRGIPENDLSRVFNLFYQVETGLPRKEGGTGLGLSICRGIISAHGGRIWAERNQNPGTTFKISLPNFLHETESVLECKTDH